LIEQTGQRVTIFNLDGREGARLIAGSGLPSDKMHVLDRKLSYPSYLREIARHKIVLQLDTSFVPGQVAGDALLCRVPCVGGNGAVDRLAFPDTSGHARSIDDIAKIAQRLLTDRTHYSDSVAKMEVVASKCLAFKVVAKNLENFLGG
jgi:hypothetical protein